MRVYSPDIPYRFSGFNINYTQVLELTLSQSHLPEKKMDKDAECCERERVRQCVKKRMRERVRMREKGRDSMSQQVQCKTIPRKKNRIKPRTRKHRRILGVSLSPKKFITVKSRPHCMSMELFHRIHPKNGMNGVIGHDTEL